MIDFFTSIFDFVMTPLYYAVSFVLVSFHRLFGEVFGPASGAAWVLSIVGLTVVIRAALIPLFVKQIKSSRNMQLIQPKVKELQKKYGHDRERLAQETMALYRESGTNPFSSCLPILLQMPIFLALFWLIRDAAQAGEGHGVMRQGDLVDQLRNAELFGVPVSETFMGADGHLGVMVMAAVLVVAMTTTMFLTQRQLMTKNMPADALSGPFAQQQKMLLYVLPLVFAVGGVAFPIGVLFYWTTTNTWTMGQQFYVIRRNPAPGTPAFEAKQERENEKARRKGEPVAEDQTGTTEEPAGEVAEEQQQSGSSTPRSTSAGRQQPTRQSRSQRKQGSASKKK